MNGVTQGVAGRHTQVPCSPEDMIVLIKCAPHFRPQFYQPEKSAVMIADPKIYRGGSPELLYYIFY